MPRRPAPPGYYSAKDAIARLNTTEAMFYKYIEQGKIHRHKPFSRVHGFYKQDEINLLADTEAAFFGRGIVDLDATFSLATYSDMDGIAELATRLFGQSIGADRRREWFAVEPRGNYVLRQRDGTVVAYLYLQPFKSHERLADYMMKRIRGWDITADDIAPFVPGEPREVMLGGIGSLDENPGYISALLRGVRRDIERLGREGVTVNRLYAYTERKKAIVLCVHLGMQQWQPPQGKRATFVLDVEQSNNFLLQPYKTALAEWKAIHAPIAKRTAPRPSSSHRNTLEKSTMPEGLIGWRAFSQLHNIGDTTTHKAITSGRLAIVEGEWVVGRAPVKGALDAPGRARFYELYYDNPHFTACPDCPHTP